MNKLCAAKRIYHSDCKHGFCALISKVSLPRSFSFFGNKDEESGSDSEFRPRRTSFEDKGKVAEKKQETVPEMVAEKKGGVGFAVEMSQENNKEAVEEVGPNIQISILST